MNWTKLFRLVVNLYFPVDSLDHIHPWVQLDTVFNIVEPRKSDLSCFLTKALVVGLSSFKCDSVTKSKCIKKEILGLLSLIFLNESCNTVNIINKIPDSDCLLFLICTFSGSVSLTGKYV